MTQFAQRMTPVKPSPTQATSGKAKALIAQGEDVRIFSSGEPDFDTADHIKEAAIQALRDGKTKYTIVPGLPELRAAVCDDIQKKSGADYAPDQVIVTCGAKQAIFMTMQVMLSPGDEVLIPAPHWVSYTDQTLICDGTPVLVPTKEEEGFKLTADALRAAITPQSKMLILNNPCNPTGSCFSAEELRAIGAVCQEHGIWVLTDEIYDAFAYEPAKFTSFLETCPEHKERTILINGVSKKYAMTGWRVGWAVGPSEVIAKMKTWQGQVVSHATHFAQIGAIAALTGPQDCVDTMITAFKERQAFMYEALNNMPGVSCRKPEGAFYAFPNVQKLIGTSCDTHTINSSMDLGNYLLDSAKIAAVAGEGFGMPGYLRLSYATSMENIREGMSRMHTALEKLSP